MTIASSISSLHADRLERREKTEHGDARDAGERRDRDDPGFLQGANALAGEDHGQDGDEDGAIFEELGDRQRAAVAQHRPGDRRQQRRAAQGAGEDRRAIVGRP